MKKILFWFSILSAALVWGIMSFSPPVYANSCQCFETSDETNSKDPIEIDGVYCKDNVPINLCWPGNFKDDKNQLLQTQECKEKQVLITYGPNPSYITKEVCVIRNCQSYRDSNCREAVGTFDPLSKYNKCWTKKTCKDSGGLWEDKKNDKCGTYGKEELRRCFVKTPPIALQVAIPGLTKKVCTNQPIECTKDEQCGSGKCVPGVTDGFPEYLATFYKFFIGFIAVAAVVMIMWGGFKRIMAAGSAEKIKEANSTIFSAIIGLVLVLISYTLLNLINPNLTSLFGMGIDKIKTELLGNWCPDPDPVDPKKRYECGDMAKIDGLDCIGSICQQKGKGCYKVSDKGTSYQGRSNDYKCLTKTEVCSENFLDEALTKLPRVSETKKVTSAHLALCDKYSEGDNKCMWFYDYRGYGICQLWPKEKQKVFCQGGEYKPPKGEIETFDKKTKCRDLEVSSSGINKYMWTFCALNICRTFNDATYNFTETCEAEIITIDKEAEITASGMWNCKAK